MNDIKAVIFDMDGVLLDSESLSDKTWEKAAEDFKISLSTETLNKCRGRNKNDTIQILKDFYGSDFPSHQFLERTSELFYQMEQNGLLHLMPYAKECLEYLKSKYRLALASSTRKESVYRQLKNLGLFSYFETLTTGDMVIHSKPEPETYTIACKSINENPENCIAIEDSPNGIKSAFSAGLKTIMVPDRIKPTSEIEKLCWKIVPSLNKIKEIL